MNMSTVMRLAGYDGLPGGTELIRKEEAREAAKPNPLNVHPDFHFSVQRDFSDDLIDLAIQVTHYRAPGNNRGLDHRDPAYDGGEVEFGDAIVVSTGETIQLTPLEWDAVESAFWNR